MLLRTSYVIQRFCANCEGVCGWQDAGRNMRCTRREENEEDEEQKEDYNDGVLSPVIYVCKLATQRCEACQSGNEGKVMSPGFTQYAV